MSIPTTPCEHKNVRSTFHGPTEIHVTVCVDCFVVIHLCSGTFPEAPPKLLVSHHGDCTAYVSALRELHHLAKEWVKDPVHATPALMEQIEVVDSAKELMENMSLPHGPSSMPPLAPQYDQHGFLSTKASVSPEEIEKLDRVVKEIRNSPFKGPSAPVPEDETL